MTKHYTQALTNHADYLSARIRTLNRYRIFEEGQNEEYGYSDSTGNSIARLELAIDSNKRALSVAHYYDKIMRKTGDMPRMLVAGHIS